MQAIYSSSVVIFVVLVTSVKTTTISSSSSSNDIIASTCANAAYPSICQTSCRAALAKGTPKSKKDVFDLSVQSAVSQARYAHGMASNMTRSLHLKLQAGNSTAMDDCLELLDISIDQLSDVELFSTYSGDVDTWLSAAITNQQTCMDSLQEGGISSKYSNAVKKEMQTLSKYICNSLSLYKTVKVGKLAKNGKGKKKKDPEDSRRFPAWMTVRDRNLLESSVGDIKADAVVAMDGTGTHSSISAALAFVSLASSNGGRSVIYVKSGVYREYVNIPKKQKNVMLMGDGKGKSVIVGSRNAADGYTTYGSATVAAMGPGFIAKGLTIINDSGPQKEQAVALRVGADLSVIHQCSIQGYQDTLYSHSNRQFYRDNDIYGTVDFIFGNAAAVYQNCLIQPRKPHSGQKNSITAQGRLDPNQNTGFSFHKCSVVGSSDLGSTPTYLGRPWHKYSRTVFMESTLDGCVDSDGWEPWSGDFALDTLYYGEYGNTGPGAGVGGRVKWGGVHSSMSVDEAGKFTVGEFIVGDSWLPNTGVAYTSGL